MKLYRSAHNRVIAGVLGGMAERFDWDPTLLRIIWCLLTVTPFPGLIIYLVLWMILPEQ